MVQIKDFWGNDNNFYFEGVSDEEIRVVENKLEIKFPDLYKELIRKKDGGTVNKNLYQYFDKYKNENNFGNINILHLKKGKESTLSLYLDPPEFFPENLVPFADDGGGNLTCFDYRNTKKDPSIVFWVHDDPEGEDVHFVANNFEEFANMLYEPKDEW